MPENPLLAASTAPFEVPPFGQILPEHFRPAFDRAMAEQRAALARVADDPVPPNFDNTVAAMERSGRALAQVDNVFSLLAGADAHDAIMAIEREVAYLKDSLVAVGRPSPLQRVAALFLTLSRNNAYEGRQPDVITDSLTCGVVAGYLGMSVDQLAARLAELEARGLIEPCEKGLRLADLDALESLADSAG